MSELFTMKMEGDSVFIEGRLIKLAEAKHLLRNAVDDIADAVEAEASRQAPRGETGSLKLHPVDREDTRFGVATGIPAFGGGTSIRGAGGRFVGAGTAPEGQLIARSTISVAREPRHAIWVHDGTGIYGPRHRPITTIPPGKYMTFYWFKGIITKHFHLKLVKGQRPNPYLTEAYLLIERTYIPARVELLRAQIKEEL